MIRALMTPRLAVWAHRVHDRKANQAGYAAVLVALLFPVVFIGCAAVSVDTARWYVEAERVQRAADAAALAGVVWMPGDFNTARTTALAEAAKNGYTPSSSVSVTVTQGDKPSQLTVKVSSTIGNNFGGAIGTPTTTVGRTSTADYAGGLSMGSPCNEFGADPDATSAVVSSNCSDVGNFWANVGSMGASKGTGDAFQNNVCSGQSGCTGSVNDDYDPNGYIYTVNIAAAMNNLRLQVFDPALISVGDQCTDNLAGASSLAPANTVVSDPATRYAANSGKYCTGDKMFTGGSGFTDQVKTSYTVRYEDATADPTRPATWPVLDSSLCPGAGTYRGYNGDLKVALDKTNAGFQPEVAANFRQWVSLCSTSYVPAGTTIAVQVKTNGLGADAPGGHNRFSMRLFSASSSSANDAISLSAFNKMAIYANVKNGITKFFLTRLPTSTAGQILTVSLFDIGDLGGASGTIKFVPPADSNVSAFTNCKGAGKVTGVVANCQFTADSSFDGKWQTVYIPIPNTYKCTDAVVTGCWVKLNYDFSGASNPTDTTSWEASIDGQPVRLIK